MSYPGDWIDGEETTATANSDTGGFTARWLRQSGVTESVEDLFDETWTGGTFTDTYPYTLPSTGYLRGNGSLIQLTNLSGGDQSLSTWSPVAQHFEVPSTLLDALGRKITNASGDVLPAYDIPREEWPVGAEGYEYEEEYGDWESNPRLLISAALRPGDTSVTLGTPGRILVGPASWGAGGASAGLFPRRSTWASWDTAYSGSLSLTVGSLPQVADFDLGASGTGGAVIAVPNYAYTLADYVSGGMGFAVSVVAARNFTLPRHRFIFSEGIPSLRQRQLISGSTGGPPLRQLANGAATGIHPLRQVGNE